MPKAVHAEHQGQHAGNPNGKEGADIRQAAHVEYLCRPECVCQPGKAVRVMEQQIHPRMNGIQKYRASDDLNASGNEPPTGIFPYKVGGPSTCTNPMCVHTI